MILNPHQILRFSSQTHYSVQIRQKKTIIDAFSIEHSWATIEKDFHDHLHLNVSNRLGFNQNVDLVLPAKNFTRTSLASEIQYKQYKLNTI